MAIEVPVIFSTDENYVPYCAVAILSLKENINQSDYYKIYIMYDSLPQKDIYRLERLSCERFEITCICIRKYVSMLRVYEYDHLTIASAYRLVIPEVFPEYSKVVYLDSDIVLNDDIAVLYKMDIEKYLLGAIHGRSYKPVDTDPTYQYIINTLGINEKNFFNAGILLINCEEFNKSHVKDRCFELLSYRDDFRFMDQCALNVVCEGQVKFLPESWNFEWIRLDSRNPKDHEVFEAYNAKIIHYCGDKPWNYPERLLADVFWKYAKASLFYEEILIKAAQYRNSKMISSTWKFGKGLKLAVYGAGAVGKRIVREISELGLYHIVLWVDKNYLNIEYEAYKVEPIEKLYEMEFDHLIIAIYDKMLRNDIKAALIRNGICREKILEVDL